MPPDGLLLIKGRNNEMKIHILIDNIAAEGFESEWGLAIHIEFNGHNILLDTGASGLFALNADKLGIDLGKVDAGVLSHNHYDHADGIETFFERNSRAKFYIRKDVAENTFSLKEGFIKYSGIKAGVLDRYANRIEYIDGDYKLFDNVFLIPHKTPGLEAIGKKVNMLRLRNGRFVYENFSHEQSLVIRTEKGLVIFNSCSHGGADNIINEVAATFPGEQVYAIIGGLHLFQFSDEDVIALAERTANTGVQYVITGHCSEERGIELLKPILDNKLIQMYSGMSIEI